MSTTTRSVEVPAPVRQKLRDVRGRNTKLRFLAGAMTALAGFLAVMMGAMLIDWLFTLFSTSMRTLLTVISLSVGGVLLLAWGLRPLLARYQLGDVAREVDEAVPELEERWSTVAEYSENDDPLEMRGAEAMIQKVASEAADLDSVVTTDAVAKTDGVRHGAYILGGISAMLLLAMAMDWQQTSVLIRRFWMPAANISVTQVTAVTGDTLVGQGEPLHLQATVKNRPQTSALLFMRYANGDAPEPVKLFPPGKGDQTTFTHEVPAVEESFEYRIRSGDGQTAWHKVTVVERPRIAAIDFRITPPAYSQLAAVHQQGLPRKIKALEGSRLEVSFQASTALSTFEMLLGDDQSAMLSANGDGKYVFSTLLTKPLTLSPLLTSEHGLKNDSPPTCRVIVYRDRAPRVKVTTPDNEIAVRPDDTVTVEFAAKDDFGITKAELVVYDGHGPDAKELKVIEIPLDDQEGAEAIAGEVDLELKEFDLKHGTEISYAVRVFDTKQTMTDTRPDQETAVADTQSDQQPSDTKAASDAQPADQKPHPPTTNPENQDQVASNDPAANPNATNTDNPAADTESGLSNDPPDASSPQDQASTKPNNETPDENDGKKAGEKTGNTTTGQSKPAQDPTGTEPGESQEKQPTDPSQPAAPSQPGDSQPNAAKKPPQPGEASSAGSQNSKSPPAKPEENDPQKPGGQLAGAPKPGDEMTRRMLDVGQRSSSKPLRLMIDEWAGSFAGQAREKLQLQIDPVLKELDEQLAAAEQRVNPLVSGSPDTNWDADKADSAGQADGHLAAGEATILKLREKSVDTPYAFIGLQLINIGQEHVGPAREHLAAVTAETAETRGKDLQRAQHHIRRARELLEQLTHKYEVVKLNEKLDETMAQIKKMHQFYVEGTFALLQSKKPTLNPKSRKFLEFEMDEEFRKKFQELLERKRDIQAELAKALANDPRLLRRYMAATRLQADTLRDQLTILARRQQELNKQVAAWAKLPEAERTELAKQDIRSWQLRSSTEIAAGAATMLDNYVTWIPLDLDVNEGELAKMQEAATMLATTARSLTDAAAGNDAADAREQAESLHRQLKEFQTRLPEIMNDHPEHNRLAIHVANRLAEVKKLITQTSGWVYQANTVADGLHHLAADVEQNRIAIDTAHLAVKLESLESTLAGMPDHLIQLAQDLFVTFDEYLLPDLVATQLALQQNQMPKAVEQQVTVSQDFARAEEQLDEIMDGIIKVLDAAPANAKLEGGDNLRAQTLEELLAMLEDERLAAENLGIPPRPNNINIEKDWLAPNSGQGGGMAGMAQGQEAAKNLSKLQQELRKANRRLKQVDQSKANRKNRRDQIRWNTLASELEDKLRQGRGHTPPEQYRRAIERYFETITKEDTANP
ncbi:hypothetical protein Mal52_49120 [Symmachiella dynata]|uniref:Uncharacterized protein n=1 Tax=Symmachiella dynata TaxID=2527995 RepID=A0A517ZV79_9PLAN|nr:hypothetical protein [Symmachiella dynata]QDU46392.1 hypothetical protein Mal52_49120 [Symmachiella dynata]